MASHTGDVTNHRPRELKGKKKKREENLSVYTHKYNQHLQGADILLLVPVSNELQSIKKFWRKYLKKYKSFSFGSLQFFHVSERVVLFDNSPKWAKTSWNLTGTLKIKKREKERESRHHSMQRQRPRTLNSATIWIDWQPYVGRQAAQFKRNTYQRPIIHAKMSVCVPIDWRATNRSRMRAQSDMMDLHRSCVLYIHTWRQKIASPPPNQQKQLCV